MKFISTLLFAVVTMPASVALANAPQQADPHASAPAAAADAVTPDQALQRLVEGNERFVTAASHPRADQDRRCLTYTGGQHPFATILSCSDSRAPAELLFDQGIGDLFVIRVAGNVSDVDEIATIEYGVGHLHTPLIVVVGHTKCGAVTAVVDGASLHGNLELLTDNIKPAAAQARYDHPDLNGAALVSQAIKANVFQSIADLLAKSEEVRHAVESGKVKIVGAVYDIHSGTVNWLGEHPQQSAQLNGAVVAPDSSHAAEVGHAPKNHDDPHAKPAAPAHGDGHGDSSHDKPHTGGHSDATNLEKPSSMAASHEYMILGAFLAGSGTASGLVLRLMKRRRSSADAATDDAA